MTDEERYPTEANLVTTSRDRAELSHTADYLHRYPGDSITFQTRLTVTQPVNDVTLRVALPDELTLVDFQTPPAFADRAVYVETDESAHYVVWSARTLPAGSRHYFDVNVKVDPVLWNQTVESQVSLTNTHQELLAQACTAVQVSTKGEYLHYLPELYERDDFMGRFLMLFESFWAPDQQPDCQCRQLLRP